jgi:hypothetical protein
MKTRQKLSAPETRKGSYDAFLSHSTRVLPEDSELVERLVHALRRRGLRIFFDGLHFQDGDPLIGGIEGAIAASAAGLVVHTRAALASGWVEFERICMARRRLTGGLRMIALQLDPNCPLPPGVSWDAILQVRNRADLSRLADDVAEAVLQLTSKRLQNEPG